MAVETNLPSERDGDTPDAHARERNAASVRRARVRWQRSPGNTDVNETAGLGIRTGTKNYFVFTQTEGEYYPSLCSSDSLMCRETLLATTVYGVSIRSVYVILRSILSFVLILRSQRFSTS